MAQELSHTALEGYSDTVFCPCVQTTQSNYHLSETRSFLEAKSHHQCGVGSWEVGWPLAEPVGSDISSRLADSVCYSFPPTTDKDSLKGNLPWLFITEIMPQKSAMPKAKETRRNTLIQLQGQVPGRGAVWSSWAPVGFKRASRNFSNNKAINGLKNN